MFSDILHKFNISYLIYRELNFLCCIVSHISGEVEKCPKQSNDNLAINNVEPKRKIQNKNCKLYKNIGKSCNTEKSNNP